MKNPFEMDDLGVPLFSETSIWRFDILSCENSLTMRGLGRPVRFGDEIPPTTIRSNAFSSFLSQSSTGYHELMEDITLPETNIDLENRPLEMQIPSGKTTISRGYGLR